MTGTSTPRWLAAAGAVVALAAVVVMAFDQSGAWSSGGWGWIALKDTRNVVSPDCDYNRFLDDYGGSGSFEQDHDVFMAYCSGGWADSLRLNALAHLAFLVLGAVAVVLAAASAVWDRSRGLRLACLCALGGAFVAQTVVVAATVYGETEFLIANSGGNAEDLYADIPGFMVALGLTAIALLLVSLAGASVTRRTSAALDLLPGAQESYFYLQLGQEHGPASVPELRALVAQRTVRPDTMLRPAAGGYGFPAGQLLPLYSPKSFTVALVLSLVAGSVGVDRFYLGHTWLGILKLITLGGCGVWHLVDIILIATRRMADCEGRPLGG